MNGLLGLVLVAAGCAAGGLWLVARGLAEPSMSLDAATRHLRRRPVPTTASGRRWTVGERLVRIVPSESAPWSGDEILADLELVGRTPEVHASLLLAALLVGAVGPSLLIAAATHLGLASLGWFAPIGVALLAAIAAPMAVHADVRTRARQLRRDLRHQLSAFLDVVTMLLAGNVGNEGALRHAASAGDGRLFIELRRRMTEAETAGRSVVHALGALGSALRIVELQQIAASASLASSEGAPVARSLAAKCSTLRSSLASEDEAAARVRTGKLSLPLVGMGIVIMRLTTLKTHWPVTRLSSASPNAWSR